METLGRVDKAGIINAARQAASDARVDDRLPVRDPKWIIATGRWEAVCSYDTEVRLDSAGHVTDVLRVIDGNWQLIYRHESRP